MAQRKPVTRKPTKPCKKGGSAESGRAIIVPIQHVTANLLNMFCVAAVFATVLAFFSA